MSWTDLHRRNEIIDEVLARAARNPADPDLFRNLPELDRLFGDVQGLLLTLQYRWRNHMQARLEWADPELVARELAAEQPALRAVLDRWHVSRPEKVPVYA
jgi:hypothetical protein